MKKSILSKKIKLTVSFGILAAGVATSAVIGINYFKNNQFKNFDLGGFQWSLKTNAQDVVKAVSENESINFFKKESLDYLRASTYTYGVKDLGLTHEKANNEAAIRCNAYEKEFDSFVDKYNNEQYFERQKASLTSPLNNVYSELLELNKKNNIEVIDYNQFEKVLLPQIKKRVLNNVNLKEQPELNQKFNVLESQAKSKILGKHLNSYKLNKFLTASVATEEPSIDKDLELAAIQVVKMISNKSLIVDENPNIDVTSLLAPYSEDGKTGYSVNSVLSQEHLNKLFLAKRDYLIESDFLTPDEQMVPETEESDIPPQDYVHLDEYIPRNDGIASFAKNEVIPGYTLRAKISDLDYVSNSDEVKLAFQIGISKTESLDENIFWFQSENESEKNEGYLFQDFKVSSFEQKLNCANNFFYSKDLNLEYSKENFDATKISKRITITDLLHDAPIDDNDYYLFSEQNPYLVDTDALEIPGIAKPQQLEDNHKNEKLMLAITSVNTNYNKTGTLEELLNNQNLVNDYSKPYRFQNLIPYVEAKWVVADSVPNSDEYKIVKDFVWTNTANHENKNTLPLYFPYSNEELAILQEANATTKFIRDLYLLSYDDKGNEINVARDIYKSTEISAGLDAVLSMTIALSSGVNDVLSCMTAFGILGIGGVIVSSAIDSFLVYNGLMTSSAKLDILSSMEDAIDIVEKFKELVPYDLAKSYTLFYDKLNDEKIAVKVKLDIALISKTAMYLSESYESIFSFFDYVVELTDEEDFMKSEKIWSEDFKNDTFFVRGLVTKIYGEKTLNKKGIDTNFDNEFLNYHNEDMISTYNILDSDQAAKLSAVDEAMIYTFKLHYAYFNLFGTFVSEVFVGAKLLSTVGVQIVLARSLGIKNTYVEWRIYGIAGPRDLQIVPYSALESDSTFTQFHRKMLDYRKKYALNTPLEQWSKNMEKYRKHICNQDECARYVERTSLNPTTKTIALVSGGIAIIAGVCQTIIGNILPAIPVDKVDIIQKLQNNV